MNDRGAMGLHFFSQRDLLALNSIRRKGPIMKAKTPSSKFTFAPLLTAVSHVYIM